MQLTMTGEYALRAVIHLAEKEFGAITPIREISKRWDIPEKFLRKIIPLLSAAGILESHRGSRGGVSLARPPQTMTPVDVIEAVEGPIVVNRCLIDSTFCHRTPWCSVHELWTEAQGRMREVLSSKSLKDLAERNKINLQVVNGG